MGIRTIEDDFENQALKIIQQMVDDFKDDDESCCDENLEEWLWQNREELGSYFYDRVDEYLGMNYISGQINWNE